MKDPIFPKTLARCAIAATMFASSGNLFAKNIEEGASAALATKLAHKFLLTDITRTDKHILAVGERGHIIYSENGSDWQQANVPVNVLLTAVSFKNNQLGYATGHDATILKTEDGGLNWQVVNYQPSMDKPYLDVAVEGSNVVAVGAYGMYMESNDDGVNWTSAFQDELLIEDDRLFLEELKEFEPENYEIERQYLLPHFNNLFVTDGNWMMAGEAGFLAKSENKGKDWTQIETEYYGSYFTLNQQTNGQLLLGGLRGNVFQSADGGENWNAVTTGAQATVNSSLVSNGKSFLFAKSGNLFYLSNGTMHHKVFSDGKALMAGVVLNESLIIASENGIKSINLNELASQ